MRSLILLLSLLLTLPLSARLASATGLTIFTGSITSASTELSTFVNVGWRFHGTLGYNPDTLVVGQPPNLTLDNTGLFFAGDFPPIVTISPGPVFVLTAASSPTGVVLSIGGIPINVPGYLGTSTSLDLVTTDPSLHTFSDGTFTILGTFQGNPTTIIGTLDHESIVVTPEPATLGLLALALGSVGLWRRRKSSI